MFEFQDIKRVIFMIFMCILHYKIRENEGIFLVNLLREHFSFQNNHGNQYKCSQWCFETHIHSH
jgi:hypothetical protein